MITFQVHLEQKIFLNYLNPQLDIAMSDWKNVYLIQPILIKLQPEVYRGKLIYRIRGTSKRISYNRIKKGLIKKYFYVVATTPF